MGTVAVADAVQWAAGCDLLQSSVPLDSVSKAVAQHLT